MNPTPGPAWALASVHAVGLSTVSMAAALGTALLLGGIIGFEREFSGQPAGLRTHISVAVGAALFGVLSTNGFESFVMSRGATNYQIDVTRVASQVVVGVGFLGAGAILKDGRRIRGLTTAASLWVTAAIGLAAGLRAYAAAAIGTAAIVGSLVGLRRPRELLRNRRRAARTQSGRTGDNRPDSGGPPPSPPDPARSPALVWKATPETTALGIDIGGSGIKGAPVELRTGRLLSERLRLPTPATASSDAIASAVRQIVTYFEWRGPVGCAFPGDFSARPAVAAPNLAAEWTGLDVAGLLRRTTGQPVKVLNDADAAGLAEMTFGAGRDQAGVVLVVTLGTGIGTAMFRDRRLLAHTELADLELSGVAAQDRASNRARKDLGLSWEEWAKELNRLLVRLEAAAHPDLIVIGGGVSKRHGRFLGHLDLDTPVLPAVLRNDAGIVGAALATTVSGVEELRSLPRRLTAA